jgi:hypothetical protein
LIEANVGKPFSVQLPGVQNSWQLDEEATAPALALVDRGVVGPSEPARSREYLRFVATIRGTMLLAVQRRAPSGAVAQERYYVVVAR